MAQVKGCRRQKLYKAHQNVCFVLFGLLCTDLSVSSLVNTHAADEEGVEGNFKF